MAANHETGMESLREPPARRAQGGPGQTHHLIRSVFYQLQGGERMNFRSPCFCELRSPLFSTVLSFLRVIYVEDVVREWRAGFKVTERYVTTRASV